MNQNLFEVSFHLWFICERLYKYILENKDYKYDHK